mmetsp:Transcript_143634/g.249099  ORF Transcript_143634/g.249099 Transcript_143634/m.249099 type:complete len:394 (-) Transcript_143634:117-1298(-)
MSSSMASMMLMRFITTYFVHLGLDTKQIGVLNALRPTAAFAGEMTWAAIIDSGFSFRHTVLSCTSVAVLLFACIPLVSSYPAIVALYSLSAYGLSWVGSRDARLITTLKNQGYDDGEFGRIRKYAALGWGASGLCSGKLQELFGQYTMFGLFVVAQFANMLIISLTELDEPPKKKSNGDLRRVDSRAEVTSTLRSGFILLFLANLLVYGFCASAVETFLFVYLLTDFPTGSDTLVGATLASMTVTELPIFHYADRILKLGYVNVFALCHVVLAIKCVLYSVLPTANPWLVLAIEPLHGMAFAAMWVAAVDFVKQYVPKVALTRFQGLSSGLYFQLAFGIGSFAWAHVIDAVGYRKGYCIVSASVLLWSMIWNIAMRRAEPLVIDEPPLLGENM